jgi:hypothetical protein
MGQLLRIFHFPRTQNLFPRTTNINRDTGNKSYYVYRGVLELVWTAIFLNFKYKRQKVMKVELLWYVLNVKQRSFKCTR